MANVTRLAYIQLACTSAAALRRVVPSWALRAVLPIAALSLVALLTSALLLAFLVRTMDAHAAAERQQMVQGALSRELRNLTKTVTDSGQWSDALRAVQGRMDREWLEANMWSGDPLYVVDPRGRTIHAAYGKTDRRLDLRADAPAALRAILAAMPIQVRGKSDARPVSFVADHRGRPALFAAIVITPLFDAEPMPAGPLRHLVIVKPIGRSLLAEWQAAFGLDGMRWRPDAPEDLTSALQLGSAGRNGYLVWNSVWPGLEAARALALPMAVAGLLFAALAILATGAILQAQCEVLEKRRAAEGLAAERQQALSEAERTRSAAEKALGEREEANARLAEHARREAAQQEERRRALHDAAVQTADVLQASIGALVRRLLDSADALDASATATLSNVEEQARHANLARQRSAASVIATQSIETAIRELAEAAGHVHDQTSRTEQAMRVADDQSDAASNANDELVEQVESISRAAELIGAIAAQTNLLALNATIEAARAGEAGRGFTVVAGEVKGLASRTGGAASEINNRVGAVQGAAHSTAELVRRVRELFRELDVMVTGAACAVHQQQTAAAAILDASHAVGADAEAAHDAMTAIADSLTEIRTSAGGTREIGATVRTHAGHLMSELDGILARLRAA